MDNACAEPRRGGDSCSREPCSRRTNGDNQTRQRARDGATDGRSVEPTAGDVSDNAADGRDYSFTERHARILSSRGLIRRHSKNNPRPEHRADYAELSLTQRVQLDDSHGDDQAVDWGVVALRSRVRRHLQMVSPALRAAILDGKDTNLASLLIAHFDLGDYSRYTGVDGSHHLLRPLSSDPRLNRNLTLAEFIAAFNKYRNIMCEVWDRRKELDAYEAIIVGIASRIEGTAFYEYHKAFSARAAALIQQHNVKLDWGVRDNGIFCSLFVGQTANVCSLCGSVAHSE